MRDYNNNFTVCQENTLLKIASNTDISEIFGDLIPFPHSHYFDNQINRIVYVWLIDGFFDTNANYKYLNDIIARFVLTANCKLHSVERTNSSNFKALKLKSFQGLKSLATQTNKTKNIKSLIRGDLVYTCIVLEAERLIKRNGLFSHSTLLDWAINNFIDIAKDKSTLKAKCRNCWNWYFERDWELFHTVRTKKDKDEVMATRVEHALNLARNKEKENLEKIQNAITGVFCNKFKKKNGSWNGKAIADYLNLHPKTVNKYLKELATI